jgi:toxin ParE1/3/4
MKVRFALRARADLQEIKAYVIQENPAAADRVRRAILAAVSLLSRRPEIGIRNVDAPDTRSKLVTAYPYRVHYRVRGGVLEILHIRHTARRPWPGQGA